VFVQIDSRTIIPVTSMRQRFEKFGANAVRWLTKPSSMPASVRQFCGGWGSDRRRMILRAVEIFLWIVAVASIGYCSVEYAGAAVHQYREKVLLKEMGTASSAAVPSPVLAAYAKSSGTSTSTGNALGYGVLGVVEIPRLGISSVVEEGVDSSTLWEAVGHIPGTAMPGQSGNSALAAHRDTYFRGLGEVAAGDLIVFRSPTADFRYRVESIKIVEGEATDALPGSSTPTLSLITCYPFRYVGPAPQRFIVTAREESPSQ
jgi:sortase A